MKTIALKIEYRIPQLFWILVTVCILFSSLYLYFVNKTILQIVSRKNSENRISIITSENSTLEARAIALEQSVTMDEAPRLGLETATHVTFIDPRVSEKALSLGDGI